MDQINANSAILTQTSTSLCILMFATFSAITSIREGEKGALCAYLHLLSRESRFTIK